MKIHRGIFSCRPSVPVLVMGFFVVPALTSTATPSSPAVALQKPAYCVPPDKDGLQDITDTPGSPYIVRHPASDNPSVPTIVFLAGGAGSRKSAQRVWNNYLSGGAAVESFRVVLPYSLDVDFIDDAQRTFKIVDEVLACYGGDASKVHLAGVSNGGLAAFALMLRRPERFATLLGAPGAFPVNTDPADWAKALASRPVFNGVGANDDGWKSDVKATHKALVAAGIESVYVEFAGQKHIINEAFDKNVFFDFWTKH